MKKPIDNYFTTGELAKLCKIPRKTLLYYDSLGLITPEVIEENGYRYYKRTQLFALELILTMRKLDIPLAEIKTYLSNKSYTNSRNIMSDREIFLEKLLKKIIKTKNELHHSLLILNQLENIKFNDVLTVRTDNEFLYLSKPVSPKMNFKDRTKISASLFINLAEHIPLNNHTYVKNIPFSFLLIVPVFVIARSFQHFKLLLVQSTFARPLRFSSKSYFEFKYR